MRGKIPDTTPISERPAGAENRSRYGHWESYTVLGMRKTGCFGTHIERKSGYLIAFRIDDRQDNAEGVIGQPISVRAKPCSFPRTPFSALTYFPL